MDAEQNPPAQGPHKPHRAVIDTVRTAEDQHALVQALVACGFDAEAMELYSSAQAVAELEQAIDDAGVLAPFGQELKIAEERQAPARGGFNFVVVEARDDTAMALVKTVENRLRVPSAQRYGWLVIEELTDRSTEQLLPQTPAPPPAATV